MEDDPSMAAMKHLDDQQVENLAGQIILSMKLPAERLIHIVEEMKAYRLFYNRCSDKDIELLQFNYQGIPGNYAYITPIRFVFRKKSSGIQSKESSNMDALLKSWGF